MLSLTPLGPFHKINLKDMTGKVKSFAWEDGSGDLLSCELLTGKGNGEIIISSPSNEYIDRTREVIVSGLVMDNFDSFEVADDTITLTENTVCVPTFGGKPTISSGEELFRFCKEIKTSVGLPKYKIRVSGLYEGETLSYSYITRTITHFPITIVNGDTDIPGQETPTPFSKFVIKLIVYGELLDERPSTPVYITIWPNPCPINVSQEGAREEFSASDGEFIPSEENLFATLKS